KRSATGQLPLQSAARTVVDEVMSVAIPSEPSGPLGAERSAVAQAKKALLSVAGSAIQKYADAIRDEQEVLMLLSNMVMDVFAMDTAICRLMKNQTDGPQADLAKTFIND